MEFLLLGSGRIPKQRNQTIQRLDLLGGSEDTLDSLYDLKVHHIKKSIDL